MGRTYFVQLGAYSDEALARSLEATYSKNYPIEVAMATSGKRGIFRVLVGPLSKDESGTVLYWFRARGFRDAFVRSAH
jgi:cell division septation protein DedD